MIGTVDVFRAEFRRIFELRPAFLVLVGASFIYAWFYPQPYLNEALRDVPIAVVDQDLTSTSREFARRVDATPDVSVAMVLPDFVSAQREVFARNIYGILLIPKNFERDLLHGRASPVALYADASYFLIYQRVNGGVQAVARTLGAEVETAQLIEKRIDPGIAAAAPDPMPLTAVPLFNPQSGYATYVLPAAWVFILQQLLLIGVGLLGTLPGADGAFRRSAVGPVASVLGKLLAYLLLEAAILPFYLIVLPYFYGIPRLGSSAAILFFAVPFVLAVSALALVLASIFRSPLIVQLVMAAVGLPFFFLAGFAWPSEAMPQAIRAFALLVPSTSAIEGFVNLSQLGAPLAGVRSEYFILWALALGYGALAVLLEMAKRRRVEARAPVPL